MDRKCLSQIHVKGILRVQESELSLFRLATTLAVLVQTKSAFKHEVKLRCFWDAFGWRLLKN